MSARALTVDRLLEAGFQELGCWSLDRDRLRLPDGVPDRRGVYAFAVGRQVQYVGLASQSLRQRLYFYGRPGVTQRTNVRLNELIRGLCAGEERVSIYLAHPPDFEWNGFRINGPEGLESGIIRDYDLPWNQRGSRTKIGGEMTRAIKSGAARQTGVEGRILELIRRRPGMTELELAKAIYGPAAQQPQANAYCRKLLAKGLVERRGLGGSGDPFVYYPSRKR